MNILDGSRHTTINEIYNNHNNEKKTVEKAYNILKEKDIIEAIHGKGHYVKTSEVKQRRRIFLIFNKLSRHKKIIYDSFVKTMGEDVAIDFYVYHNEFPIFKDMIINPIHPVLYASYVSFSQSLS